MNAFRLDEWQLATSGSPLISYPISKRATALCFGLVVLVVAARVLALLALGPVKTSDLLLYIAQADCILKTLNGAVAPCRAGTFKSVGYGFVVLSFMKAFGSAWEWGLTFFQTGFSLLSVLLLARACLALTKSLPLAAFCFAMHSLSLPLMIDPWILRDSIVASLLTIFVSYVVWHACEESPMRWSTALYLGLILGLAATLREQLVYYAIFFLPLVLVSLRAAHASLRHALLILLLLVGPMVLARIGLEVMEQNNDRPGGCQHQCPHGHAPGRAPGCATVS